MDLIERIREECTRLRLFAGADKILVALSGGADSVALLWILSRILPAERLIAAHYDHGWRGADSKADAMFSRELAEKLGVRFVLGRAPLVLDENGHEASAAEGETAAREARYRFLRETMREEGADLLAVAHHMDDQAETVLMNLCRGTGLKGLCGMSPRQGDIIRPLLGIRKQEIEAFLRSKGQEWCEDSTNALPDSPRNAIRLDVLPRLESIYGDGDLIARLSNTASLLAIDHGCLEQMATDVFSQAAIFDRVFFEGGSGSSQNETSLSRHETEAQGQTASSRIVAEAQICGVHFEIGALTSLHPAVLGRVIIHSLEFFLGDVRDITSSTVFRLARTIQERWVARHQDQAQDQVHALPTTRHDCIRGLQMILEKNDVAFIRPMPQAEGRALLSSYAAGWNDRPFLILKKEDQWSLTKKEDELSLTALQMPATPLQMAEVPSTTETDVLRQEATMVAQEQAEDPGQKAMAPAFTHLSQNGREMFKNTSVPQLTFVENQCILHYNDSLWMTVFQCDPKAAQTEGMIPLLALRTRRPGDRYRSAPDRPYRKLKSIFNECHIPLYWRDRLALVVAGDRVLWIPGFGDWTAPRPDEGLASGSTAPPPEAGLSSKRVL